MKYFFFVIVLFFLFSNNAWSNDLDYNFLVANPKMSDNRFKESVIVMFFHNKFGASGLTLNKPFEKKSMKQLFETINFPYPKDLVNKEITIHWGGPINTNHLFFIHSSDYSSKNSIISNKNFIITRSSDVLFEIAKNKGPKKFIIIRGFSIWSPGQLDGELSKGIWVKKTNHYLSIFNNGNEMWERLINLQDI